MSEHLYTTHEGDFLVVMLVGVIPLCIAEVVESYPLKLKVCEIGPFANLTRSDFIIQPKDTKLLQDDYFKGTDIFLSSVYGVGGKVLSGLRSLGAGGQKLWEILPI
ncbi:MAG: hypothetical protein L3J07_00240 [Candidatus Magasanikbacteria bacterium]|nr:hypothetical protein [Candidatus Magasanikbacteria bacterium]